MRLLLIVLLTLVSLAVLGLAIVLVPPHFQIQGVEPALPEEAELRALSATEGGPMSIRYINTSTQQLPEGKKFGHSVFLVEWSNGNLFMIDAGMDSETALEFGKTLEFALGAEQAVSHGTVAELLGGGVDKVKGIGFTHLHLDHTQGIIPLCNASHERIRAYQTTWQTELHNFNTEDGAHIINDSCLERITLQGEGILTTAAYPGLGIVGLGGHTPGSTLFAIPVDNTLWLLSGDTTNTKADLLRNRGKGFVYSYLLVPENTKRTEELRLWLSTMDGNDDIKVVVSHDLADIESSGMPEYEK